MAAEKNTAVSFRLSRELKKLLERAAAMENRSQTNMLETLLLAHCKRNGIKLVGSRTGKKRRIA
jgi:uncharacterized protein (DUF1778 family)